MDQLTNSLPIRFKFYACKFLYLHVLIRFTKSVFLKRRCQHDRKNRTPIVALIPEAARAS